MQLPRIHIGRPQRVAAGLLCLFLLECFWIFQHQTLTEQDYRYARCGREMWEKPSPLAGYFTTCGNLEDGTFAYRAAGLPLTLERLADSAIDHLRKPADRLYTGESSDTSVWEMRHQLRSVLFLEHLPFVLFAVWLGGGIWWVSRRLFGNAGGAFALALYCFSPAVMAAAVAPNNEILAAWGLYGFLYTAIGVVHAMHGPLRKWRPRIVLLVVALGLTATAHILAALVGLGIALVLMLYLGDRRRGAVLEVLTLTVFAAVGIVFASYTFRWDAFSYLLRGGAARLTLSLAGAHSLLALENSATGVATVIALALYGSSRRSRYFGNTMPLLIALLLLPLMTTQVASRPFLWSLPFLFTFLGGAFADAFESRRRRLFYVLAGLIVAAQATFAAAALGHI